MILQQLDLRGRSDSIAALLPRRDGIGEEVRDAVSKIIARVRAEGDFALRELTKNYDHAEIDDIRVGHSEIEDAYGRVSQELRDALEVAYRRISEYHADRNPVHRAFESDGVTVRHQRQPVERAGCYAPGGLARYPSTVLMCAAPAQVAGVNEIALCVPPNSNGQIDDATLAAAYTCGVDEVYRVGGAQAIAAMAYGTNSIPRVDVIAGPGNLYVAEAKRQVSGVVGIAAGFAGPSEIVVIADSKTPPELAAIDLVVQAEHGPNGIAWLVTWSQELAGQVDAEIERLLSVSKRSTELGSTLSSGGYICLVDSPTEAIEVANCVAPEHLQIMLEDDLALELLTLVRAAGAVFLGYNAPASFGDYLAGPNHILPTNGTARFASSLRTEDFETHFHAVSLNASALDLLGPYVIELARTEGLLAHAESIELRLKKAKS